LLIAFGLGFAIYGLNKQLKELQKLTASQQLEAAISNFAVMKINSWTKQHCHPELNVDKDRLTLTHTGTKNSKQFLKNVTFFTNKNSF
jgi:hypothetical protein